MDKHIAIYSRKGKFYGKLYLHTMKLIISQTLCWAKKKTDTKNGTVGILFCEFQEDQCLWVCKVPDNKASETHGSDSALKTQSRGKRNRSYGPSLTIGYLSSKAPDRHLKFP